MPQAVVSARQILTLNPAEAITLLLEPMLQYDNILQNNMRIYYVATGVKDKFKMLHMSKPTNSMKPKTSCNNWAPTVRYKLRPEEVQVCDFEIEGEMCGDEFDGGCLRNLQATGRLQNVMSASTELSEIQAAMVLLLREGLVDDFYKVAWFGDQDFDEEGGDWVVDLAGLSISEREKIIAMLQHCSGWWSEIKARVADTSIPYVDTYDGTTYAADPTKVADFLKAMYNAAAPELQYWNRNRPKSEWPVFLVDSDIFNAYLDYLRAQGTDMSYRLIIDGAEVPGVYTYNGYPIMEVPEWRMFDSEVGAIENGHTKNLRAIFTAKENLVIAADVATLNGQTDGIVVQQSNDVRDKGKTFMYTALREGTGIAHNRLMVAAYNSDPIPADPFA